MSEEFFRDNYTGEVLDERYEILQLIGEGGMARVYKATDRRLNRNVAVKIMREELFLDPESQKSFYAEAQAVAMLSHPNIVGIYDVNTHGLTDYIVMELLDGITLRQYLEKKHRVPWKQVVFFAGQISDALSHAHSKGIIHRDIKPQNIMLLRDGSVKVADFGIAALEKKMQTSSGTAIGSLNYIAPEQLRGEPASPATDVYALGIVMYELLTGFKPYTGSSPSDVLLKLETGEILPARAFEQEIPAELESIVSRAMQPNAAERYRTPAEVLQALNRFSTENKASERKTPPDDYAKEDPLPVLKVEVRPAVKLPSGRAYLRSFRRTNRISFSLGSFALMLSVLAVFFALWDFWLKDVFSAPQRLSMPSFVGYSYESITNNVELNRTYRFIPEYVVDTSTAAGTVLAQEPAAGRSLMVVEEGIEVTLSVSTGYIIIDVPDVTGLDYREASLKLQNAGFNVEVQNITSAEYSKDTAAYTSPAAGEKITAGTVVYLYVSSGEQVSYVQVPNVVGLTETAAVNKLEAAGLTCAGTVRQQSEYEAGTVIGQSRTAFTDTELYSGVTLTVSSGPWG